jgi:ParB family transcriptional regulator, chromosome partitioning protein
VSKRGLPESVRMRHDLHYVEELFHDKSGVVGRYIPIDLIRPNPDQPRQNIGDLSELVASIREKGVLEPIIVRPYEGGYQIVAGERRWRACHLAGLNAVPCIEKDVDDREMLEIALIENLQRKDLTPFEEADGLQSLAEKFEYTHAQIAEVIGKSRTSITEILALNHMPEEIKELCRQADISSRSLLLQVVRQPDTEEMKRLVDRIQKEKLTRQDVRNEKAHETRPQHFNYRSSGTGYELSIRFNKPSVTHEEIIHILETTLEKLK